MATYSVTFINNSQNPGSACLYQQNSAPFYGQLFSLAWFARSSYPGSQTLFQWTLDYSFVSSQTGNLQMGVIFQTAQEMPANPNGANTVTFGQQFGQPQPGGQPGTLNIRTESSVQFGMASVGAGMSGAAAFATQAQPNMMYTFNTSPSYWLTFGDYQQGQVLDAGNIGNAVALDFGGGTSLIVTLNADNTYTVRAN